MKQTVYNWIILALLVVVLYVVLTDTTTIDYEQCLVNKNAVLTVSYPDVPTVEENTGEVADTGDVANEEEVVGDAEDAVENEGDDVVVVDEVEVVEADEAIAPEAPVME